MVWGHPISLTPDIAVRWLIVDLCSSVLHWSEHAIFYLISHLFVLKTDQSLPPRGGLATGIQRKIDQKHCTLWFLADPFPPWGKNMGTLRKLCKSCKKQWKILWKLCGKCRNCGEIAGKQENRKILEIGRIVEIVSKKLWGYCRKTAAMAEMAEKLREIAGNLQENCGKLRKLQEQCGKIAVIYFPFTPIVHHRPHGLSSASWCASLAAPRRREAQNWCFAGGRASCSHRHQGCEKARRFLGEWSTPHTPPKWGGGKTSSDNKPNFSYTHLFCIFHFQNLKSCFWYF